MPQNIPKFIFSIGICLGVGIIGSFFTTSAIPFWYQTLNKPSFSPPNWVFGPVWTILYIVMGISLYLVWQKKKVPTIFWMQLFLNFLWSLLFFGLKNPTLALVDIVTLWIAIVVTIKVFKTINTVAAALLIPYLFWVSFATVLNLAIVFLNP